MLHQANSEHETKDNWEKIVYHIFYHQGVCGDVLDEIDHLLPNKIKKDLIHCKATWKYFLNSNQEN